MECAGIQVALGRALLQRGQIYLLLDGLDEMAAGRRPVVLTELNEMFREADPALARCVVCSRTLEYEQSAITLLLSAALELQPLSAAQVRVAVSQAGSATAPLAAALARDTSLAELLSTPLLLTIAARACAGRRDLAISGLGPVAVRRVIYDAYVVQMLLRSTTPSTPLTPILRWLHWLARYLSRNQSSLFLSERLQPTALRAQQRYKRIVGLVVGLVIALIGGPGVGLIIGLKFGPDAGLGIGCRRSWPNAAIR